ncbi:hypothetical protein BpHYR1_039111 [Brachionus plicatilis]|uniref:Uncharacterized protein n=1 Tax=Brachionus plicatilis TaxID=10195 RepID=A0A3M7SM55_BRAPC|nr:hypothetical protein BpHYR1_039111 [Brachionus plicatilis]
MAGESPTTLESDKKENNIIVKIEWTYVVDKSGICLFVYCTFSHPTPVDVCWLQNKHKIFWND